MACPFNKDSLDKLKAFIDCCITTPEIIHLPELNFFKEYLESLNATIPEAISKPMDSSTENPKSNVDEPVEDIDLDVDEEPESDLEFDNEGCIEPDVVKDLNMGDSTKIPTEEDSDKADEKRIEAMGQYSEGNFDKSVELLTDAIILNPASAVLFVKRGQSFLQLKKPNACIKDCTHALELNPDSAAGFKFRGRAYRLLGDWENAAKDLRQACKIDFDEQADEWLKEVQPNAHKIEQHRLKQERKKSEREVKERLERVRKAKEAHAKAAQESGEVPFAGKDSGVGDFYKILQDPEVVAAFKDPEVAAAFQDISMNPANFAKYQSNPKVMELVSKISNKFQGPSFSMGGFPGMGSFSANFDGGSAQPTPDVGSKIPDDDILD